MVPFRTVPHRVVAICLVAVACGAVVAQVPPGTQAYPSHYPPALPRRKGDPPPRLVFRTVDELQLPGALEGSPPEVEGERVRIALDGAVAHVSLAPGAAPSVETSDGAREPAPSPAESAWVESPDGRYRFQARAEGQVVGEKRRRSGKGGFRRRWTLRVPGATAAPPLLSGRRLFFATRHDQVQCVRADNGHLVWAVDVADRVTGPLAVWRGDVPVPGVGPGLPTRRLELILVSPDRGGELLALDPYNGSRVAILEIAPSEGKLATGVATLPGGEIVVGREPYSESSGSLLVLRLEPAPEIQDVPATSAPGPYGKVPPPGRRR